MFSVRMDNEIAVKSKIILENYLGSLKMFFLGFEADLIIDG